MSGSKRTKRTVEDHGEVDGLPISSIAYEDGRAFVAWGQKLLPLTEVDKLIGYLREARVEAALRASGVEREEVGKGGGK